MDRMGGGRDVEKKSGGRSSSNSPVPPSHISCSATHVFMGMRGGNRTACRGDLVLHCL